jgi:hypothetical protein
MVALLESNFFLPCVAREAVKQKKKIVTLLTSCCFLGNKNCFIDSDTIAAKAKSKP